jgi:hypothetical protein
MNRLSSKGIAVKDVMRFVRNKSGAEVTMLSLLEKGEIPEADAQLVCDTYPGTGWHWNTQDRAWEQRVPAPELAHRVSVEYFITSGDQPLTSKAPFLSLPDKVVAAHMASAIRDLSKKMLGVEFRVKHDPLARWLPSNHWIENMPEGFLALASDSAIKSMEADRGSDTLTEPWFADAHDEFIEHEFEAQSSQLLATFPVPDAEPGRPRVIALTGKLEGSFSLEGYPSVCYASRELAERMAAILEPSVQNA